MTGYKYTLIAFILLLTLWIVPSCFNEEGVSGYIYQVPEQSEDGWETADLAEIGMDPVPLYNMMEDLQHRENHLIHAILIVRGGYLVFEEYFAGHDMDITQDELTYVYRDFAHDTLHFQAAVTKSVTSILTGIAIDKGLIDGVGAGLFSFFPEYSDLRDAEKDKITLAHLLAMSSGLPWDESYPYDDSRNDLNRMLNHSEPVRYVLEKSLVASPGTTFIYNSGTTNILGDIVRRAAGDNLIDFAEQYLFTPLGITTYTWVRFPSADEVALASSGLYLRPRDMAKLGQLYLQEGLWDGQQIVPSEWVNESMAESIEVPNHSNPMPGLVSGYGYQWWLGTYTTGDIGAYLAAGYGGQFIVVMPDLEMVVVVTAGVYDVNPPFDIHNYIINGRILDSIF